MSTGSWTVLVATALVASGLGVWWQQARGKRGIREPTITTIPPGDLLYSLPTLCDVLPPA